MAKDNVGRTPLHIAAAESNKVFFKQQFNWCQQKGFDYLAQSTYGWSVVEEAASGGCVPILQMLASGGVEVISNNLQAHGQHRGTPALHLAAIYSHLSCVNYLMSHGADPLYLDVYGRTAMDWANLYAHDKVFSLLHRHNFCYAPTDAATRASILKESVVGLAKRMLSGDRADFYKLGKCLQYLDNIPAAATAYSLGQIKCRDCDFAISHTEASFACRRCSDIHLCSECMNEFIVGDNIFRTYCQHDDCERFILGEHALPEQAGGESAALEAAWARWFTELIATYSQ
ncbi:ankyrin repeat-containing domain protein [Aspergillus varians]